VCTGKEDLQVQGDQPQQTRREVARVIYSTLSTCEISTLTQKSKSFAHKGATWPAALAVIFQRLPKGILTDPEFCFVDAIATSLERLEVEVLPGQYNQTLSYQRVTKLVDEWNVRVARQRYRGRQRVVIRTDENGSSTSPLPQLLSFTFPLTQIPENISNGWKAIKQLFREAKDDRGTILVKHIADVELATKLDEPAVELAILIVSILMLATPLPSVLPQQNSFVRSKGANRDKEKWAAVLFVKMLWFVYPELIDKEITKAYGEKTRTFLY